MTTTGFILPGARTVDAGSGTWTNDANILANDGSEATFSLAVKNTTGRALRGQTFGFDALIPSGDIITKVEIRTEWRVNNTGGIGHLEMQAFVSGTGVGSVTTNSAEPTTLTTETVDITSSRSWTRADLLDGTFELRTWGRTGNSTTDPSFRWDHLAVQITHQAPPATPIIFSAGYGVALTNLTNGATSGGPSAYAGTTAGTLTHNASGGPHNEAFMRLTSSGRIMYDVDQLGSGNSVFVCRFYFRWVGAIPSVDDTFIEVSCGTASKRLWFTYRTASTTIEANLEAGGTDQLASISVAADIWYRLEFRYDVSGTTHSLDWGIAEEDDSLTTQTGISVGSQVATTVISFDQDPGTNTYDTAATLAANTSGSYPLGIGQSAVLVVDSGTAASVSGTSSNFQQSTNNGSSMVTLNTSTAPGLLNENPPDLSGTADLVAQVATAASDTIAFAHAALGGGSAINAVVQVGIGWAATSNTGTLGMFLHDGTTEGESFAVGNPNFDSTTTANWLVKQWPQTPSNTEWDASTLTATRSRFGKSSGADDIGFHALYLEVDYVAGGDATATPGAIAAVASVPNSSRNVGAGPASISLASALPLTSENVAPVPATVAAAVVVPNGSRNVAAGPATVPAVAALGQVAAGQATTVAPASVPAVAALAQPLVNVAVPPAAVAAVAALGAVNLNVGAGPAVISRTVVIGQATPVTAGNATATPAAITGVGTLDRALVNVAAGPSTIEALATVTAGLSADITSAPAVTPTIGNLPQATPQAGGNATAAPSPVAALAALGLATPQASVIQLPAVLAAVAALGGVAVGVGASPAVLAALSSLPRPDVHVAAGPLVLAAVGAVPAPTVTAGGNVTVAPAVLAALAALGQAIPLASAVAGPVTLTASAAVVRPLVDVGAGPATIARSVVIPQATATAGGGATPTPATIAALAALTQPAVNVRAGPLVIPAVVGVPAASPGQAVTASPTVLVAAATLPAAHPNIGAGPAVIALIALLPLVADVGGEPNPGGGIVTLGRPIGGLIVRGPGGGLIILAPNGNGSVQIG